MKSRFLRGAILRFTLCLVLLLAPLALLHAQATLTTGTPFNIVNENSGLCIGASAQGTANGTVLQMNNCANGTYSTQLSQEWIFTSASSGYYEVSDANATAEAWNVVNVGTTSGSIMQIWSYGGASNEEFDAVSLGNGYYKFVGLGSGLCLDVPGNSTASGVQLEIYTCNGTTAQAFKLVTPSASSGEGPYGGVAAAIPGTVMAENYDTGGQGVGYSVTSINGTANSYRSDGVDLEAASAPATGNDLGWSASGQWFRYTVKVSTAGNYTVSFLVAAESAISDAFHISNSSGTNLSGSVPVPDTGGWQTWTTVTANVTLPAGTQTLTVNQDNAGWNLNYATFAAASTSGCTSKPSVPSGLAASGTTSSSTTLSWTASTVAPGCAVTSYTVYEDDSAISTVSSGTSYAVGGLAASTSYGYTVAATDSDGTSAQSSAVDVTTSSSGGGGTGTTTGTIGFHLLLGVSGYTTAADSMTLAGGNYNDLIMSNFIAGVMYGHIVEEGFPGIQLNKDYLYGSIMGQLLQENLETEAYESSSNLIDPTADQQAVMGEGQGGPYQINDYVDDMVAGAYTAEGHALVNYIAIQKNIGYTVAGNAAQADAVTPPSFNNKYYGPMLPAFFHYNDMVALKIIGTGAGGWVTPWQPEYDEALANFVDLPNSFLDVILNVAYNQGYYGGLVASYSTLGATATASTVATVNSYSSVWGNNSTYSQYPYQVHYYLDQMYDNPIPTTSATITMTPTNHIAFSMSELETVFTNVFELLDYSNGTAAAQYFTAAQAQTAFNAALASNSVSISASLDLSIASQRAQIYAVINSAITNLETASGMKFNATTTSQL